MKTAIQTPIRKATALFAAVAAAALFPLSPAHADEHEKTSAIAVLHPTEGNDVTGIVKFTPTEDGKIKITATVKGLKPDSEHGFHIHQYGDCSAPDATSAGGHYDPHGHEHGVPDAANRHAGDMGNLETNAEGVANFELVVDNITISEGDTPIIGRSVIVHANKDDGSQPTGNAGPRVACGVIGFANPGDQ